MAAPQVRQGNASSLLQDDNNRNARSVVYTITRVMPVSPEGIQCWQDPVDPPRRRTGRIAT